MFQGWYKLYQLVNEARNLAKDIQQLTLMVEKLDTDEQDARGPTSYERAATSSYSDITSVSPENRASKYLVL